MPGVVAVTGATGFIGHGLLTSLSTAGWRIKALTRKNENPAGSIEWISGTLEDRDALQELVRDTDAVIHCAGRVRGRSADEFHRTNVQGTENLVRLAAGMTPQPRFLLISSLAAREPQLSWYAHSKYLAERVTIEQSGNMPWTIFRPTAVYGPGDRELSPVFKAARLGVLPVAGLTSGRFGLIHIDDLVSAIQVWLLTDSPPRGIYELDDGTPGGYDHKLLSDVARQVWNRPVLILRLPIPLLLGIAGINLWLARLFHYSPMLTPGKVRELRHQNWVCDNSPLTRALGWKPKVEIKNALSGAILSQ